MPRKTAKRICTLLIGVAAMLLFASTANANCPTCQSTPLECTIPLTCQCLHAVDILGLCNDGTTYHTVGPCCSCT